MASRKKGLFFFYFDVNFFGDKNIKILRARYGSDGIVLYIYILCEVYKDNGYYMQVDDDFIYTASSDLNMSSEKIGQMLNFLLKRSLLDSKLFQSDKVLTSTGIQKHYQDAVKERGKKNPVIVNEKFWILSEEDTQGFIKVQPFSDNSENLTSNSGKKASNSGKTDLNKIKINKIKENKSKAAVVDFYEQNIGMLSRTISDDMDYYLSNEFEPELIIACIKKSVDNNKRTWSYAKGILDNLSNQGIKTVKEWKEKDGFSKNYNRAVPGNGKNIEFKLPNQF